MQNDNNIKEYNDEDVWYCRTCLSLKVINLGDSELVPCYCGDCGSADIGTIDIQTWELMYHKKYKKNFINKK